MAAEEMHWSGARAVVERGYNMLVFDGPGQFGPLRRIISAHASAFLANPMSQAWPRGSSTDAAQPSHLGFDNLACGAMLSSAIAGMALVPRLSPKLQ